MSHGHGHGAGGEEPGFSAFAIGVVLNGLYVGVEVVAGLWADSLALLSDALHNASDVLALGVAWGSAWLARLEPSKRRTYGWSRATILSSLFSGVLLLVAMGAVLWEALHRLSEAAPVDGGVVAGVAAVGVVINTATAVVLAKGRDRDLNRRGAWLNMSADAALSAAVVAAGLLISATGWWWLDPAMSVAVAAVVCLLTWGLLRDSLALATDAVPPGIDPEAVQRYLGQLPGVREAHDLHIWPIGTTRVALTVHLVMPEPPPDDGFLVELRESLDRDFGIGHAAIQVERGNGPRSCPDASTDTV